MKRRNRTGYSIRKMILAFILITVMAVLSGYGLTKYIIRPLFFGLEGDGSQIEDYSPQDYEGSSIIVGDRQDAASDGKDESSEGKEVQPESLDTGGTDTWSVLYSVQYGSFSDIIGAKAEASSLSASNIPAMVLEKGGAFKVVGEPFITKEEAVNELESIRNIVGSDPFITTVEVKMK